MMVEGNIVLVPDADSLRSFMGGLPAFFLGEDFFIAAGSRDAREYRQLQCIRLFCATAGHEGLCRHRVS